METTIIMSVCTFLVGLGIGYYKSLSDLSKLYCLKSDCAAIRAECIKHKDQQDQRLNDGQELLTKIQIDIMEIKTLLKSAADKK